MGTNDDKKDKITSIDLVIYDEKRITNYSRIDKKK